MIRASQLGAVGISATDGVTIMNPAVNQYETCLRCHGTSTGKQTQAIFGYLPTQAVTANDGLNLLPQMSNTAPPAIPVRPSSAPPQPSLLSFMFI